MEAKNRFFKNVSTALEQLSATEISRDSVLVGQTWPVKSGFVNIEMPDGRKARLSQVDCYGWQLHE